MFRHLLVTSGRLESLCSHALWSPANRLTSFGCRRHHLRKPTGGATTIRRLYRLKRSRQMCSPVSFRTPSTSVNSDIYRDVLERETCIRQQLGEKLIPLLDEPWGDT